ncbi:MAG: IS110 family transposase [Candidatus Heimdallarchaeota archaeon]
MRTPVFEVCGCDVHKSEIEVAWLDLTGQKFRHGSFENTPEGNQQFWTECERLGTKQVAMESTGIYWKALYHSCPQSIQATVFNSATIKLKTRPKTDVKDAMWIARCLRAGFINPSNITLGKADEIKSLCRMRTRIVEEITAFKNQIHAILDEYQRKLSSFTSGMNTQLALHTLTALSQQVSIEELENQVQTTRLRNAIQKRLSEINTFLTPSLPPEAALALELALRGLLDRSQACFSVEQRLVQIVQDPAIHESVALLTTIPGISGVSGLQLYIELGRIERFPSKRQIVAWAGLCPRVKSSGGITTRGSITKRGNAHVRRIMFQAARASLRAKENPLKPWYDRLKRRKPGKVALVALARKLLVIAYTLLKTRQVFEKAPLVREIKVYSTAKRLVQGLTTQPIAPLLEVLVKWLETPRQFQTSISGVFDSMHTVISEKRRVFS